MGWYNLTTLNSHNQTTIGTFVQDTSAFVAYNGQPVTGFVICMIILITFFTFLKSKGYSPQACYAVSSWLTFIIAMLLQPIGLIGGIWFMMILVMAGFSFIMLWWFQSD